MADEYDKVISHAAPEVSPRVKRTGEDEKLILVMVGLPARGKSYISNKSVQYFSWLGYPAKLFNVGAYRRTYMANEKQMADFFAGTNTEAKGVREEMALYVLNQLLTWLDNGGSIAVFDATNTTRERRGHVLEICRKHNPLYNVIFVESMCDKEDVLRSNMDQKVRHSPDYRDMPHEAALADLQRRIDNYMKVYEPVDDDAVSFIKLINLQSKVICNRIHGELAHMLVAFVMSVHIVPRPIFLIRPGHYEGVGTATPTPNTAAPRRSPRPRLTSEELSSPTYSRTGLDRSFRSGSASAASVDSLHLSPVGEAFSEHLGTFLAQRLAELKAAGRIADTSLTAHTSTMARAVETMAHTTLHAAKQWSALNPLDTGICYRMNQDQIKQELPDEYEAWQRDLLDYRMPGGESLHDMVKRLGPFVIEIERETTPIAVVSHVSPLRFLYGYFMQLRPEQCPHIDIPRHSVIELLPTQYGWEETRYVLDGDTVLNTAGAPLDTVHESTMNRENL